MADGWWNQCEQTSRLRYSSTVRYVRAHLNEPPSRIFFLWGDLPDDLAEWIQPPDTWRVILYGHQGTGWQNARPFDFSENVGALFWPGVRGAHAKIGPHTDVIAAYFDMPATGPRPLALPTTFASSQDVYDALVHAAMRGLHATDQGRAYVWNLLWTVSQPVTVFREQSGIYEAEDYVRDNLDKPLRVEDLSRVAEVSPRTLLSWFQAEHGTTVKGYIRQVRAREACRLLADSNQSIKAIAARVGVPDLHQFNKLVRVHCGLSPREYRIRSS